MNTNLRVPVLAALAALSFACACAKEAQNGSGQTKPAAAGEPSGDTVVATFGDGTKITAKELDEHIAEQLAEMKQEMFRMRRQGLDGMVIQRLVKAEAAKKGMTEDEWIKKQIDESIPQPSEEEIKKFFETNVAPRMPEAKLEDLKARIVDAMLQPKRQEKARELFENLKKTADVKITLAEPERPRKQVEAKGPSKGAEGAKITIVEFSDFQCPYCSRAATTVEEVMQAYPGKLKLVFRHFPLSFHEQAPKAAEASMCAHEQGKFWEMHDLLFKNQQKLAVADLKEHATTLGLDTAKFNECLDSGKNAKIVQEDTAAGQKLGVSGTPAFFINGVMLSGAQPIEEFRKVIDPELAAK